MYRLATKLTDIVHVTTLQKYVGLSYMYVTDRRTHGQTDDIMMRTAELLRGVRSASNALSFTRAIIIQLIPGRCSSPGDIRRTPGL